MVLSIILLLPGDKAFEFFEPVEHKDNLLPFLSCHPTLFDHQELLSIRGDVVGGEWARAASSAPPKGLLSKSPYVSHLR